MTIVRTSRVLQDDLDDAAAALYHALPHPVRRVAAFVVVQALRIALVASAALILGLPTFSGQQADGGTTSQTVPQAVSRFASGLLVLGLLAAAGPCFRLARRMGSPSGAATARDDRRAPVLYLRPFVADRRGRDDDGLPHEERTAAMLGMLGGGIPYAVTSLVLGFYADLTFEEELAQAFRDVGPFITVGRPGETLPPAGAARIYLSDDHWRADVEALLSHAGAVVLRPGRSAGLRWEIGVVRRLVDPRRVLVVLPNAATRRQEFEQAVAELNDVLHVELGSASAPAPSPRGGFRHRLHTILFDRAESRVQADALVTFDEHWRPTAHALQAHPWWLVGFLPSQVSMRRSLRPFVARLLTLTPRPPGPPPPAVGRRLRHWLFRAADVGLGVFWIVWTPVMIGSWDDRRTYRRIVCPRIASLVDTLPQATLRAPAEGVDTLLSAARMIDDTLHAHGIRCPAFGDSTVHAVTLGRLRRAVDREWPRLVDRVRQGELAPGDVARVLERVAPPSEAVRWAAAVDSVIAERIADGYVTTFEFSGLAALPSLDTARFASGVTAVLDTLAAGPPHVVRAVPRVAVPPAGVVRVRSTLAWAGRGADSTLRALIVISVRGAHGRSTWDGNWHVTLDGARGEVADLERRGDLTRAVVAQLGNVLRSARQLDFHRPLRPAPGATR